MVYWKIDWVLTSLIGVVWSKNAVYFSVGWPWRGKWRNNLDIFDVKEGGNIKRRKGKSCK